MSCRNCCSRFQCVCFTSWDFSRRVSSSSHLRMTSIARRRTSRWTASWIGSTPSVSEAIRERRKEKPAAQRALPSAFSADRLALLLPLLQRAASNDHFEVRLLLTAYHLQSGLLAGVQRRHEIQHAR